MNDGVYGGGGYGGQQGGYNDSAKTCYACGGFGIKPHYISFISRSYGERLHSRSKMLQLRPLGTCQP